MSTPEETENLSRDATHSTYAADPDAEEQNPPSGPQVIQTLGKPAETAAPKSSRSSSSSSSSS